MKKDILINININKKMIHDLECRAALIHLSADDYIRLILIDWLRSNEQTGEQKDELTVAEPVQHI